MTLDWLPFAFLNVAMASVALTLTKFAVDKLKLDNLSIIFGSALVQIFVYSPIFVASALTEPIVPAFSKYTLYLVASIILNAIALFIFVKAIKSGELSFIGPLENLRPLFVALLAAYILHEGFRLNIFFGIILVVIGAFVIHLKASLSETWQHIKSSKVSLYMLAMALLYSLAAITDKLALAYYNPTKYVFYLIVGISIFYFIAFLASGKSFKGLINRWTLGIGIAYVAALWGIFMAFKLASPTLVTPVQMLRSIVLAFVGMAFFSEKKITLRIIGAALMIAGIWFVLNIWLQ